MINFANKIKVTPDRFTEMDEVIKITAYSFEDDTKQMYHRLFPKEVKLKISNWSGESTVSFGGYCEYYAKDLLKQEHETFPDYCIDAGGRNHAGDGSAVYVSRKVAVALAKKALGIEP